MSGSRLCYALLSPATIEAVLISLCHQFEITTAVFLIAWIVLLLIDIARDVAISLA